MDEDLDKRYYTVLDKNVKYYTPSVCNKKSEQTITMWTNKKTSCRQIRNAEIQFNPL